jgi:hypothetical protein
MNRQPSYECFLVTPAVKHYSNTHRRKDLGKLKQEKEESNFGYGHSGGGEVDGHNNSQSSVG